MPVKLYGANLFGRALTGKEVRHLNNAPGGPDGVDADVQYRLGAPGSESMLDRQHGICCGITVAWIIGVCHRRKESINPPLFEEYFKNVLRFQGAYAKDKKGNQSTIDDIDDIQPHGLVRTDHGKCKYGDILSKLPQTTSWASYLGIWHHAIGVARSAINSFYIMDPNGGLFVYTTAQAFESDLHELCEARRVKKGEPVDAKIRYNNFQRT